MSDRQRVALVMCGSFNPITNMHLRMLELARDALRHHGFDPFVGILSPVSNKYDKPELASPEHRCNMIREALKPQSWIYLDTWECNQKEWTPTVNVLNYFQLKLDNWNKQSGQHEKNHVTAVTVEATFEHRCNSSSDFEKGNVKVMFLCGADLLESFASPDAWTDEEISTIVGRYGIVCINRYGCNADRFIHESEILYANRHNIFIVTDWIVNEISSTKVRRALRRGESVRHLVPDEVIDYIYKHKLFGAKAPRQTEARPQSLSKIFSSDLPSLPSQ